MTIGVVAGPFVLNPVLRDKLAYDTLRGFSPITRCVRMPQCCRSFTEGIFFQSPSFAAEKMGIGFHTLY